MGNYDIKKRNARWELKKQGAARVVDCRYELESRRYQAGDRTCVNFKLCDC
jgi:hypothetical protein